MKEYILCLSLRSLKEEKIAIVNSIHNAGYKVLLLDKELDSNIANKIDEYISCDLQHTEQILEKIDAFKEKIVLCQSWVDTHVKAASYISDILNISGIDKDLVDNVRNKYVTRSILSKKAPKLTINYAKVESKEELLAKLKLFSYPMILKPLGASGSKGIFLINNFNDALNAWNQLNSLANDEQEGWLYKRYGDNSYILEEYIEGKEFSVEGLIVNNKIFIAGITDKLVTSDFFIEYLHVFPSLKPKFEQESIFSATKQALKALQINNCFFHLEARIDDTNRVKIIEVAGRIGGGCIASILVSTATGIDWISTGIKAIVNNDNNIELTYKKACGIGFILANKSGKLKNIELDSNFNNSDVLIKPHLNNIGKDIKMPPASVNNLLVSYFVVKDDTPKACWSKIQNLQKNTTVEVG